MSIEFRVSEAMPFIESLSDDSVDLVCIDPPYFNIVNQKWDTQWFSSSEFEIWLLNHIEAVKPKMKAHGSLIMFGGLGKHGEHPFFRLLNMIENQLFFRNMITWKKRRAYGKSHDYLFCREEIAWFSKSNERTNVRFNIPLLNIKRGYAGYNPLYPAKSEYKRVSNVWDDIPELMRPRRECEKPLPLMERLISTHSNECDLVIDFFAGTGVTGRACKVLNRNFMGCDKDSGAEGYWNEAIEAAPLENMTAPDVCAECGMVSEFQMEE